MLNRIHQRLQARNLSFKEYQAARKELDRKHGRYVQGWKKLILKIFAWAAIALSIAFVFPAMVLFYNDSSSPFNEDYSIKQSHASERDKNLHKCISLINENQVTEGERCLSTDLGKNTLFLNDVGYAIHVRDLAIQEDLKDLELSANERIAELKGIADAIHSYPVLQRLIAIDLSISQFKESPFYKTMNAINKPERHPSNNFLEVITETMEDIGKNID